MLPPVRIAVRVIKVMPAQLPACPPCLPTAYTKLKFITYATISIKSP